MSCAQPLHAWYGAKRDPETGNFPITFHHSTADLDRPLDLPCNNCLSCKADQSMMWSIRCYHELTEHDKASFVTLTYDEEHLPKDNKLNKDHLRNFIKTLRKHYKIRYFACGEYGDKNGRPHYHLIIFGEDFKHLPLENPDGTYTSRKIQKHWNNKGNVVVAPVTMASICYTCGYVSKKLDDKDTFNSMSTRPGLGKKWLDKNIGDLMNHGFTVIDGRQYQIPKRYLMWYEHELEHVKLDRAEHARINPRSTTDLINKNKARIQKWKQRKRKL